MRHEEAADELNRTELKQQAGKNVNAEWRESHPDPAANRSWSLGPCARHTMGINVMRQ